MMSVDTQESMANYVNERVVDVPLRILNRGPDYIRSRMMNRDSALFRHNRRSAVELLAETKPLYVRSENSPNTNSKGRDYTDSPRVHRSRSSQQTTAGVLKHWTEGATNDADSQSSSRGSPSTEQNSQNGSSSGGIRRSTSSPTPCQTAPTHPGRSQHRQEIIDRLPPPPPPPPRGARGQHNTAIRESPAVPVSASPSTARLTVTLNKTQPNTPLHHPGTKFLACSEAGDVNVGQVPCGSHQKSTEGPYKAGSPPQVPPRVPVKPAHLHGQALRSHLQDHSNTRTLYNGPGNTTMDIKVNYPHSKDKNDSKKRSKDIPTISTEEWRDNRTDTSSELDQKSSHSSFKMEESATVVRRRHRKAISRSRSDLTKRYSNSSDFSELSSRLNRNSADLEKFFNEMGLDHNILEPLKLGQSAQAQSSSSLNLFESVSCLGSTDARSCFSEESLRSDGRLKHHEPGEIRTPGSSAIVERNARIIKWLCNIKVASSTPHLPHQQKSAD